MTKTEAIGTSLQSSNAIGKGQKRSGQHCCKASGVFEDAHNNGI